MQFLFQPKTVGVVPLDELSVTEIIETSHGYAQRAKEGLSHKEVHTTPWVLMNQFCLQKGSKSSSIFKQRNRSSYSEDDYSNESMYDYRQEVRSARTAHVQACAQCHFEPHGAREDDNHIECQREDKVDITKNLCGERKHGSECRALFDEFY